MIESDDLTLTKKQRKKRDTTDALAKLVEERFKMAAQTRMAAGISELMLQCRRASLAQPLTGAHADPAFPVIFDLVGPISRGLIALLRDTLTASAADLFTLMPTADPALTPEAEEAIIGALEQQQLAMFEATQQIEQQLLDMAPAVVPIGRAAARPPVNSVVGPVMIGVGLLVLLIVVAGVLLSRPGKRPARNKPAPVVPEAVHPAGADAAGANGKG